MISVTLYSKKDCHLCEQARLDLKALQDAIPHRLTVLNIDSDEKLRRKYGLEVPVVEVGPYCLKAPFTQQELRVALGAARDRERDIEQIENSQALQVVRQGAVWTRADRISLWIARHYLAMLNLFVVIYMGLPFLAPVLMNAGWVTPAGWIYRGYSFVCHQLSFRSFFLFGEQFVYPRAAAGLDGYLTLKQATGLGEESSAADYSAAAKFVGDEFIGYKVALCERDVAIYGGILLFGLLFPLTRRRLSAIPWYMWILVGILPIALDGFSQLLSQPPFNFWAFRESTPFFRVMTGGLFGFMTAWFSYPLVEETMSETRALMEAKKRRAQV